MIVYIKNNLIVILKCFLLSLLVIIGTFPSNDWSFFPGIDPPLSWVFNYLFDTGLIKGKDIIFPHGPLAFLMYPLQENILLSILVNSILKGIIVFNLFWLGIVNSKPKWLAIFIIAYLISAISGFNHLILAALLLMYCNYFNTKLNAFKIFAFIITAFAFYVKAYVAIVSGILFFSFTIYCFFESRKIKQFLIDFIILIASILLIWLVMYRSISGLDKYFVGMFNLAQDNSSAAAYYPYNNWTVLIIFFAIMATIFLFNRGKSALFYVILVFLSLFAAWKHGMAREDIYHVNGFIVYIIICLSIFILFKKKNIYINLILSICAVFILSINLKYSYSYSSTKLKYNIFNYDKFYSFASEFSNLKQMATNKIKKALKTQKISEKMLKIISNSSVDIYPWDYSIIPANNLNWKPRPVIQSYASYTPWLDQQNADHFMSENAPDYLIWEFNKISKDVNGSEFSSIDKRYLLNDEPKTIIQLLKSYEPCLIDGKFQLFIKREEPISIKETIISNTQSEWGKWIEIPQIDMGLLRAKLNFEKSISQRLKSLLYKDEQFWIYLKMTNGLIHKYRIVPKNAKDGIWINPYVFNSNNSYTVNQIMIRPSNQRILSEKISLDFEKIEFVNNPDRVKDFFKINNYYKDSVLLISKNDFEQKIINWSYFNKNQYSSIASSGTISNVVKPNALSSIFSFSMDSIPFQKLKINTDCLIKASDYNYNNDVKLVISIINNKENHWDGIPIDLQMIDNIKWNHIYNYSVYNHNKANCTLKVYISNNSNSEVLIDDFRAIIIRENKL